MHAGGSARLLLVVRLALSILSVMIIVTTPPCNSQCDAGLDVRAPMYWNGQWVIIQVVDCGVVQPEFEADMSGATDHQPDADADIYSIPARWNWYPPPEVTDDMQCYFKTDWNLRIAAGSGPVNSSAMYSAASVSDLPESGEVPDVDVLNQFEVFMYCYDNFVSSVSFQFWFSCGHYVNSTDGTSPSYFENVLFEEYSFALRWACYPPGCNYYCEEHGTCMYPWGYCLCDEGWSGIDCQIKWDFNHTLCPSQALSVTYNIPPITYGTSGLLATMMAYTSSASPHADAEDWFYPITWTQNTPSPEDPLVTTGVNSSGVFPTFLPPGTYLMSVWSYAGDGRWFVYENFYVLDYDQCGYSQNDVLCGGEGSTNNCFNTTGNGMCINEACWCNGGYYWFDCSRGCPGWTRITAKKGVITSDASVVDRADGQNMHYVNNNVCRWFLDMSGFRIDIIHFAVTFLNISSDFITIYYSDSSGRYGDIFAQAAKSLEDFSEFEMDSAHAIIEFDSGPQNTLRGFIMEYEAKRRPITPIGIGVIIVVCAIVAILGLTAGSVALFFLVRRQRRIAKEARMAPAEFMETEMTKEEIQTALAASTKQESDQMLEKMRIAVDKSKLTFGLSESDACPVSENLEEEVTLTNRGDTSIHYRFSVPDIPHVCELNATPGVGILPAKKELRVRVEFMLKYTTHFEHPVKLEFLTHREQEVVASTWLAIQVEGAVSESIDPEEVMLNPTPLAAGGFGSVYGGIYRSQMVAVKIPKHQEAFKEEQIAEFSAECELMKRIRHPNVVNYIGASHVPGKLCICIELVEKGSLGSFLNSAAEIPFALTLKFAINSAEAMSFLHKNNVLFRDLKCANILVISTALDAPVNCKLTDFGTARNVENADLVKKYTLGIGTPAYMAPEILSIKPYNFKVDVFSFGMCLWEMWMRDELWSGVRFWDIPCKIEGGVRPEFNAECPQEYSELTKKCWSPNPEDRPEFHEVRDTLTHIHDNSTEQQLNTTTKPKKMKPEASATTTKTTSTTTTTKGSTPTSEHHSHNENNKQKAAAPAPDVDDYDAKSFNVATGKDQQRLHQHLGANKKPHKTATPNHTAPPFDPNSTLNSECALPVSGSTL